MSTDLPVPAHDLSELAAVSFLARYREPTVSAYRRDLHCCSAHATSSAGRRALSDRATVSSQPAGRVRRALAGDDARVHTEVLTEQDADFLLHLVIRHSSRAPEHDRDLMVPVDVPAFLGPGDPGEPMLVRTATGSVVRIEYPGQQAIEVLARRLRVHLGLDSAATDDDLSSEVRRLSCSVIDGSTSPRSKRLGRRLLDDTAKRLARSVVVLPVTGVDLPPVEDGTVPPLHLSDRVLLGRLDDATQQALTQLATEQVGGRFTFSDDAWWTEDYNGRRRDPTAFEEPDEPMVVMAVVVDAVDMTASLRARHLEDS